MDSRTASGRRLLAHELAHVVQQGGQPTRVQRDDVIDVELITYYDRYTPPGGKTPYRVGDAAASSILMKIEQDGSGEIRFFWFNFARGEPHVGSWEEWDFRVGAAVIGMNSKAFAPVGRALTATQWGSLWPDPRPHLLKMYEQGTLSIPDDAIVGMYKGMIHNQALKTLDENEKAIDALLAVPDRVAFFQRYADGLREASVVRDALEVRKADIERSMVQSQGFSFGMAGRTINMNPARRLQQSREKGAIEQSLKFWLAAFPLLTRLPTAQIKPAAVEATLRTLKSNIADARRQVALALKDKGSFELLDMDNIRAQVDASLGAKARQTIKDEDKSRRRWGWVKAGAALAVGIALLFVPGGVFIDLAIGISMGVDAWEKARDVGRAANTGMDVDAGLFSQAATAGAEFEAALAIAFAVLGTAGAGLRVLRVGRMLSRVRQAAPALEIGAQVRVARVLASNQTWLRAGGDIGELNRQMLRAGSALRFEELRALRAMVYEAQRAHLPAHSAESLAEFMQVVWGRRQQVLQQGPGGVYNIYSTATEANPLTRRAADYMGDVAAIARGRPAGAVSNVQATGANILDLAAAGRFSGTRMERTFFRFERAGTRLTEVRERVYLNVSADKAPEVMRTVVRDIVDNPAGFPGVRMAKLTGPAEVSRRADAIVIYVTDAAEARKVVARLRTYQSANPRAFKASTPYGTEKVMEGVSLGSEPLAAMGGASFGQVRSQAIYDALQATVQRGGGPQEFARAVADRLRRSGVDPDAPHLNLPGGTSP
jgi:hypothetical protein